MQSYERNEKVELEKNEILYRGKGDKLHAEKKVLQKGEERGIRSKTINYIAEKDANTIIKTRKFNNNNKKPERKKKKWNIENIRLK